MVTPLTSLSSSSSRHHHNGNNNNNNNNKAVVRTGPLCIGLTLLFAVPLAVICVWNTRLETTTTVTTTTTATHGVAALEHHREDFVESSSSSSFRRHPYHKNNAPMIITIAESQHAKCLRLENNAVVLEETDSIQVIVVDKQGRWWFLVDDDDDDHNINHKNPLLYLFSGYYLPQEDQAPWFVAKRLVNEYFLDILLLLLPQPMTTTTTTRTMNTNNDIHDNRSLVRDGQVPSYANTDQWQFLGRTPSQKGGGFVYSYLHFLPPIDDVTSSSNNNNNNFKNKAFLPLENTSKVYEALLEHRFPNVKAYVSIAMAMAYLQDR